MPILRRQIARAMIDWIFDTKWKRRYEKHRDKIEEMGYDKWITSPLDLSEGPFIIDPKIWKALNDEAKAFIECPRVEWK